MSIYCVWLDGDGRCIWKDSRERFFGGYRSKKGKWWRRWNGSEMWSDVDVASCWNWLDRRLFRLNGKWHFNGQVFLYLPSHFVAFEIPSLPASPQWHKKVDGCDGETFKTSATAKTWQQYVTSSDVHCRFTIVLPILSLGKCRAEFIRFDSIQTNLFP